jgi:hypothetical protein
MIVTMTGLGALADAKMLKDGSISSGSATLTSPTAGFTAGDVGKVIVVGGAGPSGVKLKTTIATCLSATQVTLAASASTAVSGTGFAWGADCSAALLAGLEAIDAARGGKLLIDGCFLLTEPVSETLVTLNTSTGGSVEGTGTDSCVIIAVDANEDAITLAGGGSIDWKGVSFLGIPDAGVDANRVLVLSGVFSALEQCQFLGLLTQQQCVSSTAAGLDLSRCTFGGTFPSAGGAAVTSSVVYATNWSSFRDKDSGFLDYSYWRGLLLSKSGLANTSAWIGIGAANDSYLTSGARNASLATLEGTAMDEGSLRGVWFEPGAASRASLELKGTRHNVNSVADTSGVFAFGAESVLVDRCVFGLSDSPGTAFGRFATCGRVKIDGVILRQGVDKIVASNVGELVVDHTEIANYELAGTNLYFGNRGTIQVVKDGPVTDADFDAPPSAGAMGLDTAAGRLYVRGPGDWGYAILDGGSLFAELVVNGTGDSTAGWIPSNSSLSVVAGKLRVTNTAIYGRASQVVGVSGGEHRFSVDIAAGTASGRVKLLSEPGGAVIGQLSASGTINFTPTTASVRIELMAYTEGNGKYCDFDNISLREL